MRKCIYTLLCVIVLEHKVRENPFMYVHTVGLRNDDYNECMCASIYCSIA